MSFLGFQRIDLGFPQNRFWTIQGERYFQAASHVTAMLQPSFFDVLVRFFLD